MWRVPHPQASVICALRIESEKLLPATNYPPSLTFRVNRSKSDENHAISRKLRLVYNLSLKMSLADSRAPVLFASFRTVFGQKQVKQTSKL